MLTDLAQPDFTLAEFTLPAELEAHDPPEARGLARDGVRMLVSRRSSGEISHHGFRDLPGLLLPGDLLVVNTTATLPAQVRAARRAGRALLQPATRRRVAGRAAAGQGQDLDAERSWLSRSAHQPARRGGPDPGGQGHRPALASPALGRGGAVPAQTRHPHQVLLRAAATGRCRTTRRCSRGSRAARRCRAPAARSRRPWSPQLVARGVLIAPLTLHTGVSSLEADEDPYPEPYDVPPVTARLVNHVRADGGRIIAAGTTVVRALETAALAAAVASTGRWRPRRAGRRTWSRRRPGSRWWTGCSPGCTSRVPRTCGCWPRSPDRELLSRCYETAIRSGYLWHEFGDVHLLLP